MVPLEWSQKTGGIENQRNNQDQSDYSIIGTGKNILEDLRKFAFTQTPVKDQQLKLVWKTRKEENNWNKIF